MHRLGAKQDRPVVTTRARLRDRTRGGRTGNVQAMEHCLELQRLRRQGSMHWGNEASRECRRKGQRAKASVGWQWSNK